MAITYPLSLPDYGIARVTFGEANAIGLSQSPFTFQQQVQQFLGDAWTAEVTLPSLPADEAAPWLAFVSKLKGQLGTFLLTDRTRAAPRGVGTGTPLVKGAGQTGSTLITDGWTPSITGIMKAGDHISIANRLYKILNDANSDGSGEATFDIWPRLRASPSDNAPITVSYPAGTFRLANNLPLYSIGEDKFVDIAFAAIEAR